MLKISLLVKPPEVKEFSQSFDFIHIIRNTRLPLPTTELITACLRQMSQAQEDHYAFLVAAGKELSLLLRDDYQQLEAILRKVRE